MFFGMGLTHHRTGYALHVRKISRKPQTQSQEPAKARTDFNASATNRIKKESRRNQKKIKTAFSTIGKVFASVATAVPTVAAVTIAMATFSQHGYGRAFNGSGSC